MLWSKDDTDNTNVSGLPIAGMAIGVVSFVVLLAAMVSTFYLKTNPFLSGALWFIGDMGVGFGLALIWAGERGISLMKFFGFLAVMLLSIVGLSAAGFFGIGWIVDTFQLNTPDGDTIVSLLFLFVFLVPAVLLFVVGMKWFERRFHY